MWTGFVTVDCLQHQMVDLYVKDKTECDALIEGTS